MHIDRRSDAGMPSLSLDAEHTHETAFVPETITAFLVGLGSKVAVSDMLRHVNEYRGEPLLAIIPGVALQELWGLMAVAENALRFV